MKTVKGWHFVGETLRDGSPIPADGKWLRYTGHIEICSSGLHFSRQPFDALRYAPGATLCYVECSSIAVEENDKAVCANRKIIARMDATELLYYFARMQAVSALQNWKVEPPQIVCDWLMLGDAELKGAAESAARSAAWSAAESAARSAARSAAESAAESAAWSAAWSAAESAAWSAAWSAAESAARSAAWSAAESAAWSAAWSAAESAARSAAESAACEEFNALVYECFADYLK